MIPLLVAVAVLALVGVLLWKAVAAQALATGSGQNEDDAPTGPTRTAGPSGRRTRPRPVAPDDDPEFLRGLDEQLRNSRRDDPPSS